MKKVKLTPVSPPPPVVPATSPVSPPPLLPLHSVLPRWEPLAPEWEEPVAGPLWAEAPPRRDLPWGREALYGKEHPACDEERVALRATMPPPPLVTINMEAFAAVMGLALSRHPKEGEASSRIAQQGLVIPLPLKKRCTACQRRSRSDYKPRNNCYEPYAAGSVRWILSIQTSSNPRVISM